MHFNQRTHAGQDSIRGSETFEMHPVMNSPRLQPKLQANSYEAIKLEPLVSSFWGPSKSHHPPNRLQPSASQTASLAVPTDVRNPLSPFTFRHSLSILLSTA